MTSAMLREIGEQPGAVERTVKELVPLAGDIARLGDGIRHVLFIARGSSDNAAVLRAVPLHDPRPAGSRPWRPRPMATAYDARVWTSRACSRLRCPQSGAHARRSSRPASLGAQRPARVRWPSPTTATPRSTSGAEASPSSRKRVVEEAVPATKTYTTQLAALAVLGLGARAGATERAARRAGPGAPAPSRRHARRPPARPPNTMAQRLTYVDRHGGLRPRLRRIDGARALAQAQGGLLRHSDRPVLRRPAARADRGRRRGHAAPCSWPPAEGPVLAGNDGAGAASLHRASGAHVYGIGGDDGFAAACRSSAAGHHAARSTSHRWR